MKYTHKQQKLGTGCENLLLYFGFFREPLFRRERGELTFYCAWVGEPLGKREERQIRSTRQNEGKAH